MPREFRYDCPGHQYLSHDAPCPQCAALDPGPQLQPAKPSRTKKHYVTCAHCEANFRLPIAETAVPIHRYQSGICPGGAQLPAPNPKPAPLIVWVVNGESNGDHFDGQPCGWIEGVYTTEEAAQAALDKLVTEAKAEGLSVYCSLEEDEDEAEWDRDFTITQHQVLTEG